MYLTRVFIDIRKHFYIDLTGENINFHMRHHLALQSNKILYISYLQSNKDRLSVGNICWSKQEIADV